MDGRLEQAIALLSGLLGDEPPAALTPWLPGSERPPSLEGRVSATDRLSWWFRPAAEGHDPWDGYFEPPEAPVAAPGRPPSAASEPPGRRAALRLLLDEPDEELIDADADAVVCCLYDFVHALGRGDVSAAIEHCVALDYHVMEHDVEIDRDGLAAQLHAQLQRLRGWDIDVSLVEIPEPILHPEGILVYAEVQIEATRDGAHQIAIHQRLAVFRQDRERRWKIAALSPVTRS